jgi:hypothetical protein
MQLDLAAIGTLIQDFFGSRVEDVARRTQFVMRLGKLGGRVFLQAVVFAFIEKPNADLGDIAQVCLDLGVEITPQGLDQRINKRAIAYLKEMFSQAMTQFKNQVPLPLPILQQFSAINIVDSSLITLPPSMAETHRGCGGDGPEASLKVQLVFEFLLGNLNQITLQAGREPDQKYRDYLQEVKSNSLTIVDLGYFFLDAFKAIMTHSAYFLSRLSTQVGLLTPTGRSLDLLALLQAEPRHAFEMEVLLGKQTKHRLPCRLICRRVPQEIADRRRHKAKKNARRKGRSVSQRHLALMDWTLFLTNAPASMLSLEQIVLLYRVRWQIELVFKLWKSYCGLSRVAGLRQARVLVELYAKMIGIVLSHFLVAPIRMPHGTNANREISPVKVREILQRFARDLCRSLAISGAFLPVMEEMFQHIARFGFKEKRRRRPNVCHALALASPVYVLEIDANVQPSCVLT